MNKCDMKILNENALIAYLDGEVTRNQAHQIETALMMDSASREKLARLRAIRTAIKPSLPGEHVAEFQETVFARINHGSSPEVRWRAMAATLATLLVAMIAAAYVLLSPEKTDIGTFTPRSANTAGETLSRLVGIDVFLHKSSDPLARTLVTDNAAFGADDGFSFVVYNRTGERCYLMIVGIDTANRVHWFYPSIRHSGANTESVVIQASPTLFPLPEGVSPGKIPEGKFTILAIATSTPVQTEKMEASLKKGDISVAKKNWPAASIQLFQLISEHEHIVKEEK